MWTLQDAKIDYRIHKPIKPDKKKCKECTFASVDWEGDVYCTVKEKHISWFTGIRARRCRYFTSKYPNKIYRK